MPAIPRVPISVSQKILPFIHAQLGSLRLSVESIEKQSLEALESSLNKVNEYINHPESLRSLRIQYQKSLGYYFSYSGLVISFDAVVRPILLNRKNLIVGRLEALKLDNGIQSLGESIKGVKDEVSQLRLTNKIQGLRASSQSLDEQLIEASKEQEQLRIQIEKEKLSILEGKFKILLSLLKKEAAATLIGVIFIIISSFIWIVAMIAQAEAPFVLKDFLFLVFGYFFGHATHQSSHID